MENSKPQSIKFDVKNSQTNPNLQTLNELNIVKNNKQINALDALPPEAREKIQQALGKLGDNPGFMNFISSFSGIAKTSLKTGAILLSNEIRPTTPPEAPQQVGSLTSKNYAALNLQRNIKPTFNPNVQNDHLRRNLFIIAATLIIGYLIIKFGFNGELPL